MLRTHRLKMVVGSLLAAASFTACGGGSGSLPGVTGSTNSQTVSSQSSSLRNTMAVRNSASPQYVGIDAGGAAVGTYGADTDYNSGAAAVVTSAINTSKVVNPAPPAVYQSQRYGQSLVYTVPNLTPNAAYSVRLHFVESFFSTSGQRVFGVSLNGVQSLSNFDIFQAAGGQNVAIVKSFTVNADASGKIAISLAATKNNASIAAIDVTTAQAPGAPGVAISAGGTGSGAWVADTDFSGGWNSSSSTAVNTSQISNAAPQTVYTTQRVGSAFSYAIPKLTPGASYSVRLDFVEPFFTSAGQRVFNVSVNGSQVLSNFDIYATAGGTNVAISKTFAAVPDATGTIALQFAATANNASVTAIDVVAGTPSGTPTPTPTPVPTSTPVATGSPYTNYSALFTGNTPFHHKVATMAAVGVAAVDSQSSTEVSNWINQIAYSNSQSFWSGSPVYISKQSDPIFTWQGMNEYGSGNPILGTQSQIPAYAQTQAINDSHIMVEDQFSPSGAGEYGGFQCDTLQWTGGITDCGWGAYYLYSGSGLSTDTLDQYAASNHAGYAAALGFLGQYDFYQAHHGVPISHALVLTASCTQGGTNGIYPAVSGVQTDTACPSSPTIKYGSLLHLKLNSSQIAATGASEYCRYILQAAADYGVYIADTTGVSYGPALGVPTTLQDDQAGLPDFVQSNVEPSLLAGGDGSGSPDSYPNGEGRFHWGTCLNRVWQAGSWDAMHITTNTGGLPAISNR